MFHGPCYNQAQGFPHKGISCNVWSWELHEVSLRQLPMVQVATWIVYVPSVLKRTGFQNSLLKFKLVRL